MIRETVEIAKAIKEWNPDFPIILGGWHPSLLPTQTLEAPYIDYVVCGQGEESFLELVGISRADLHRTWSQASDSSATTS